MLEAPADLVAGQRAMAELLLRDADRLDVEDAVDDAEIVVDEPMRFLSSRLPLPAP